MPRDSSKWRRSGSRRLTRRGGRGNGRRVAGTATGSRARLRREGWSLPRQPHLPSRGSERTTLRKTFSPEATSRLWRTRNGPWGIPRRAASLPPPPRTRTTPSTRLTSSRASISSLDRPATPRRRARPAPRLPLLLAPPPLPQPTRRKCRRTMQRGTPTLLRLPRPLSCSLEARNRHGTRRRLAQAPVRTRFRPSPRPGRRAPARIRRIRP